LPFFLIVNSRGGLVPQILVGFFSRAIRGLEPLSKVFQKISGTNLGNADQKKTHYGGGGVCLKAQTMTMALLAKADWDQIASDHPYKKKSKGPQNVLKRPFFGHFV
jgi:hypothetical protein